MVNAWDQCSLLCGSPIYDTGDCARDIYRQLFPLMSPNLKAESASGFGAGFALRFKVTLFAMSIKPRRFHGRFQGFMPMADQPFKKPGEEALPSAVVIRLAITEMT